MTSNKVHLPQIKVPATYMRGGTSKGVFFSLTDLPQAAQVAGAARDALLLRVIGSPDPYGKQTDGMGGATSSTSKTVILSKSTQADHDVDYLFGQVAIDKAFVDWSGNCGNLSAAVGAFAIHAGLVDASRIPENGIAVIRIWQANISKTIIAHVPITHGEVQETGDFELDGVTFPAAEIGVDFIDPADKPKEGEPGMFPTGNLVDEIELPPGMFNNSLEPKKIAATMINAGIPTIFVNAEDIGYRGDELQEAINGDVKALEMFESLRAIGAVQMGLIQHVEEAQSRQHTPKIVFVSPASSYTSSSGKQVERSHIDFNVRALSMGKLHHAMMGTAAVAIGTAAVIPGTLVNLAANSGTQIKTGTKAGSQADSVCFGHPSGTLKVGAAAEQVDGQWTVTKVSMSRSARILMEGWVRIPDES
ncbi:2-methylaconitate cis-trans isomerase PrpF [Shewanella benthica]|uniref:2-methylaconitate cis-trans isomerase PrpF n=1 Tax=Shewanella benthica TaxID=43661 RepID=UPI00187A612F|nr:2-methylaconitate cis-trans isomerase PrpF [Shewanella benthica]MBE7214266.1 2-methylaconitate cis-trans isomerase PrpF [Shewanella benthica]MCL1062924.1 2-methylaconitate cis-trans isomerase PrpF [Shewanella benthica]